MCGETPRWAGCGDPTNGKGRWGAALGSSGRSPDTWGAGRCVIGIVLGGGSVVALWWLGGG